MILKALEEALGSLTSVIDIERCSNIEAGSVVKFAKSSMSKGDKLFTTQRVVNRAEPDSWTDTKIELFLNGELLKSFPRGEDPRFLTLQSQTHLYFQEYIPELPDCAVHLYNIDASSLTTYWPSIEHGVNGKNWAIYEENGQQYCVYSIEPLQVFTMKDGSRSPFWVEKLAGHTWGDDSPEPIGSQRAGSMPIFWGDLQAWMCFTHITRPGEMKPYHQLGLAIWKSQFQTIQRIELTKYKEGLLIDPYHAFFDQDKIKIDVSVVLGELHKPNSIVQNFRLILSKNKFKDYIYMHSNLLEI